MITLFFLRPIVDAYRVGMHQEDSDIITNRMIELHLNKVSSERSEASADKTDKFFLIY